MPHLTRRALALAAAAGLAATSPARAADQALVDAARKEGTVVWYSGMIVDRIVRPISEWFERKYPGIKVQGCRLSSSDAALKIINEARAGKPQADIFDGTALVYRPQAASTVGPYALPMLALAAMLAAATTARAEPARRTELVQGPGGVVIETYVEGSGPSIVMLPSTGRDGGEDFDAVAERLAAAGFTVLRPQPRGAEGSRGPMTGVSLHDLAADVVLVIDRLGRGRAVIVGHAFGHFVARMAAVDHPAAVRGVVLAAAAASVWAPEIAATPGIAGDLARPDAERLAALRLGFFAPGHDPTHWLKGWWPDAQRVQVNSREKAGVKQSDWWGAGTAPLLELIPASDPFKPRDKWEELRTSYGDRVTTVVIPDASHALFPEQPAAVADAIIGWVKTLPP